MSISPFAEATTPIAWINRRKLPFLQGDHATALDGAALISARAWLVPALAVMVLIAISVRARPADVPALPAGTTCDVVRQMVAEHGRARALAWAIEQGYSWRQIRAARRCLD